jgi:hypothetical protein
MSSDNLQTQINQLKEKIDMMLLMQSAPGSINITIEKSEDFSAINNYKIVVKHLDQSGLIIRSQSTGAYINLEPRHVTPTNLSSFTHALRDLISQYFY